MLRRFRASIALCIVTMCTSFAYSQTTYTWNYTGTNWNNASSWSPGGGPPTSADTALFDTYAGPTPANFPALSASTAVGRVAFHGPRSLLTMTWSGNGNTLTLGTGGTMNDPALTLHGGFSTTIGMNNMIVNIANGTSFAGSAATLGAIEISGNGAVLQLQNNSTFRLTNVAGTQNYDLVVNGAQLALAAGTTLTNGINNTLTQGRLLFQGGGILSVNGFTTGTALSSYTMNQVAVQSGHTQINLQPLQTSVQLTLGKGTGTLQSGIDRLIRDFNGSVIGLAHGTLQINSSVLPLPGASGLTARLFAEPGASGIPMTNGIITMGTSANSNAPYVLITGATTGVPGMAARFATYDTTSREILAQAGTMRSELTINSAAANENTVLRTTATSVTVTANLQLQSLILEKGSNGLDLSLGSQTLTTNGIAIGGPVNNYTFSLTGGTLAGTGSADRMFFVPMATSSLVVTSNFAGSSGGAIVKAGPGNLILNGTTDQMAFSSITDVVINSGLLRARIDGAGMNFGTSNNAIQFRGGLLGIDAQGGVSTFTRSLGASAGQVNWTGGIASQLRQDRGSGGFVAFNGTVNINIGGAAQTLEWNGTGTNRFFLRSGDALKLGSTAQTGILNFQNGIALDDSTGSAPRDVRQITALGNASNPFNLASRIRFTGTITGGPNTQLAFDGNALVEINGANTYAGGTRLDNVNFWVNNTSGSATGTGPVVMTRGSMLGNGTIAPSAGNGMTLLSQGTERASLITDSVLGTPGNFKFGSDGVNNPLMFQTGAAVASRILGSTFDPNGSATSYGRLTVRGTGTITIDGSILQTELSNTFTPLAGDAFGILDNQTANALTGVMAQLNGTPIPQDGIITLTRANSTVAGTARVSYVGNIDGTTITATGGNDLVIYGFTPVPEPGLTIAVISLSGLVAARIRRRLSRSSSVHCE